MIRFFAHLLDQKIHDNDCLILAHRGISQGNIVENTIAAMQMAFALGADAVEMDVVMSTDGDFFVFHDGCEPYLFDNEIRNIRNLSTTDIQSMSYVNNIGMLTNASVETLADFINALPADKLMNMDRSWFYWETLLPYLDNFDIAERLLLKSPANALYLEQLAKHDKKYLFFAICFNADDVERALSFRDTVNLVGVELIVEDNDNELMQAQYLQSLKEKGLYLLVNSLNLGDGMQLWGSYDDDTSVLQSPELGWGKIMKQGIDIINTDWTPLLVDYRKKYKEFFHE